MLAPFYGDAERDGRIHRRAAPRHSLAAEYPLELTLALPLVSDASALRCTSHEAAIEAAGAGLVARLADDARLDRDVVFLARREPQAVALAGSDGERAVVVTSTVLGDADVAEAPGLRPDRARLLGLDGRRLDGLGRRRLPAAGE